MQFTNYRIYNKEEQAVLFENKNTACFAEFTSTGFDDKNHGFGIGRYMEVYFKISVMKVNKEIVKWWTEYLDSIGLSVKLEEKELDIKKNAYNDITLKGNHYVWTFDFDKYTSKAQLKLALHLIRYLYESQMHVAVVEAYKYLQKEENKDAEPWEIFQFMHMFHYPSGHCLIHSMGLVLKPLTLEVLNNNFNSWIGRKYSNMELGDLFGSLRVIDENKPKPTNVYSTNHYKVIKDYPELKENMSYKDYELFYKL